MPRFFIRALNAEFSSRDAGSDYDEPRQALDRGVEAAIAITADEILKGHSNASVEVTVELADGAPVLRSVVTLSVSPLIATRTEPHLSSDRPDPGADGEAGPGLSEPA